MGEVLTKLEFARRGGVDPAAVSMWISRGHLSPPALLDDGRIDVERAVHQLRERLDHARHPVDLSRFGIPEEPGISSAAAQLERQRLQKIEEADLRLRRLRREELERTGMLVNVEAIGKAHAERYQELLAAVEQWVPDLAVKLGADRDGIAIARREWRSLRERLATAVEQQAQAHPEHVEVSDVAPSP